MTEDDRSRTTSPSRYTKATHLTEFYPYLNGGSVAQSVFTPAEPNGLQQAQSQHSRKQSLSSYTSFTPSTLDFRSLVTKTEISHTSDALDELLSASEKYRKALALVAEASADFGAALEKTAKCKGAGVAADGLLSAGGLFFLVANHQQLLAHSVEESFEAPVRKEVEKFKKQTKKNDDSFKVDIKERVHELKQQEKENAKLSRSKTRNLVAYRTKLMQLTFHIDEIDKLKHEFYQSAFDLVQETSSNVLTQVGSVVRAQVEIYEGIARKGWSGGGLDELIAQCPDPFTPPEEEEEENVDILQETQNDGTPDTITNSTVNSTLKKEPELKYDNQGISFNRGVFATKPVLSHQQSTQTFGTINPMTSSTPIMMSPESPKRDEENEITMNPDDNSFSLPVPGSARLQQQDNESDHSSGKDMLTADLKSSENIPEDEQNSTNSADEMETVKGGLLPSPALEQFPIQNEWDDNSGDSND